jgi:hypothetical protein
VPSGKYATKQREEMLALVADRMRPRERVVAVLPFAQTGKRPKPPKKVRDGIYQSYRRYRPLVATDRRLFVLDTARTPHPRNVLAEFPIEAVTIVDVVPGSFGQQRVLIDLPDLGPVPFDVGRYDLDGLTSLRELVDRG